MQLNLKDPDSIVLWWRSFPERHWSYLEVFEACTPQFRPEIRVARLRIKADPLFDTSRIEAFDAQARAAWMLAEQAAPPATEDDAIEAVAALALH
jgi:hypothetical protein